METIQSSHKQVSVRWLGLWVALGVFTGGGLFSFATYFIHHQHWGISILGMAIFPFVGISLFFNRWKNPAPNIVLGSASIYSSLIWAILFCAWTQTPAYKREVSRQNQTEETSRQYEKTMSSLVFSTSEAEEWQVVSNIFDLAPNAGSGVNMVIARDPTGKDRMVFFSVSGCGSSGQYRARVGQKIKVSRQKIGASPDWQPGAGEQFVYFAHRCAIQVP